MGNKVVNKRDSGEIFIMTISSQLSRFIDEIKQLDIVQFIGVLFIMYSFNSYFGLSRFDSQPFPFLLAIVFLMFRTFITKGNLKSPVLFLLIGILSFVGVFIGTFVEFRVNMLFIRGVINYASIFILMMAFYEYIKAYGFPLKILVFMNILWLLVGVLQLAVPDIVNAFVQNRTSIGRGVTSLSPEPSSFGMHLFFMSWMYLLVTDYKPPRWLLFLVVINVISIFFLAISAITIVFLMVTVLFYLAFNFRSLFTFKRLLLVIAGFIIFIFVIFTVLKGSRMEQLFYALLNADIDIVLESDRSVNSRLAHQVLPVYLFFSNLGFPMGLQTFVSSVAELDVSIREALWGNITNDKIMSWNATLIYELGVFSILIWVFLYTFLMDGTINRFGELSLLFVLLFSSIPQSYPLIPMIFVIMYMTNKHHNSLKSKLKKQQNYLKTHYS